MKLSAKHILLETILLIATAFFFSLFAKDFYFWLIICLIIALIWHHNNEFKLLSLLYPQLESKKRKTILEYILPTQDYWRRKNRKEKIKTLRLLSKLNKHIQYFPEGIIICQKEGEILWCNSAAQEIFSFYWHKKAQKNIFSIIFYPEFKDYFNYSASQHPLVLLTEDQRYIEISANIYDSNNILLIVRDVTQLIRLLHTRQTFLSNVNHELRTPLTVLKGYLELLAETQPADALYNKAIQAMQEQSQRMSHLLDQLSLLAKIEHSNNEHYPVNLSEIIHSLQKNTFILNANSQRLLFDIAPNLTILGDENQLQSAVSNLIYNAIRHAGKNAQIHIRWQPCEDGAIFSVSDNGIGIAEKHLPHLTERFYRVDESRNNQTGGSGLGLAIVKHILEQHHTHLDITSQEGQGSTFSFLINKKYLLDDLAMTKLPKN